MLANRRLARLQSYPRPAGRKLGRIEKRTARPLGLEIGRRGIGPGSVETREPRITYDVVPAQAGAGYERFMVREKAAERADALARELGAAVEVHEVKLYEGRSAYRTVVYTAYP
jgi:hypothetical protein